MDVSIIIVNYNTKELLSDCLKSIFEYTKGIEFEVLVSDNGSSDGSVEMLRGEFPQVIVIENKQNLGFGAANNRALSVAKGKYVFYLNSDTVLLNNAVKIFFDYWENSTEKDSIGALGCNLLDEEMNIVHSYGDFPSMKKIIRENIFDFFRIAKLTLFFFLKDSFSVLPKKTEAELKKKLGSVDYITGADLFVKNDDAAKFDERFFLYFEETDLEKRMDCGGKVRLLVEGPSIIHFKSKSNKFVSKIDFYRSVSKKNYVLSSLIYMKKHSANYFALLFLKVIVTLMWFSPFLIKANCKYISRLWKI